MQIFPPKYPETDLFQKKRKIMNCEKANTRKLTSWIQESIAYMPL